MHEVEADSEGGTDHSSHFHSPEAFMHTPFSLRIFMKKSSIAVAIATCAGATLPLQSQAGRDASKALCLVPVASVTGTTTGAVVTSPVALSTVCVVRAFVPHAPGRALQHNGMLM